MNTLTIFILYLTFVFNIVQCYQVIPFHNEFDSNLFDRKDNSYLQSSSYLQSQSPSEQYTPIINYYASFGDKKVYSVFMPIDKEVHDLMPVESNVRPAFADRAGPKMSNKAKKQLNVQMSNGFTNFGDAFGQSFGDDFAQSFSHLSKHSKKPYSSKGQQFGRVSGQTFVRRRANLPQRLKNIIKYF